MRIAIRYILPIIFGYLYKNFFMYFSLILILDFNILIFLKKLSSDKCNQNYLYKKIYLNILFIISIVSDKGLEINIRLNVLPFIYSIS